MAAGGFRAAQAYVEVTARLNERDLLDTARRAGGGLERQLREAAERAGREMERELGDSGERAGDRATRGVEGRLRDARGRFRRAGSDLSEELGGGAEREGRRSGFRAFLGLIGHAPMAGLRMAGGLVGSLGEGLKNAFTDHKIAAPLIASAIALSPALGAALAGGIMAGMATVGIAGGVILAAQDPAVKYAWAQTGGEIGDILQDAAAPFRGELIGVAERVTGMFQKWQPLFHQIFGTASKMLEPFVSMLDKAGTRFLASTMTLINHAGPAVNALADGIGEVITALADMFDGLQDNGAEAAVGLNVLFFMLSGTIRTVGWVVNGLTEAFGFLLESGLSFLEWLGSVGQSMQGLPGPLGAIGDQLAGLVPVTQSWRGSWDGLKKDIKGATDVGSQGTSELSERTKFLSLSMGAAIKEAGGLSQAFKLLNGGALSAREAESAYQAAIDNVTKSMKENGKTLDLRTEKGRANDAALRQLITTTDQKAQATYDEIEATQGAAAAEAAASKTYEQGRQQLIKSAMQMGLSKKEAVAYADKLMAIPKTWSTTVTADTKDATAKVTAIKSYINSITGKTVHVKIIETREGDHYMPGQGRQVKGAATGGRITGGSGWKDDVPLLAMGGEWVIQRRAVEALEHQFGPDFMQRLNTWHLGGEPGAAPRLPGAGSSMFQRMGAEGPTRHAFRTPAPESPVIHIGAITLDASGLRSIQDVVELIRDIGTSARSYRARTATLAGR